MLLNVLKRLGGKGRRAPAKVAALDKELAEAHELGLRGDPRKAIKAYERYLESDPSNLEALNGLGACLAEVGDNDRATQVFELAHSMDDTFVPAMVNFAKLLTENNRAEEGMAILRRAKISAPVFTHCDAVYAALCLRVGDAAAARHAQLKAWLANFDNLRLANCFVFWSSYDDIDEALVASEHRFWAETLQVVADEAPDGSEDGPAAAHDEPATGRKLRIGYWSPDFRNHSVRYFSRPLLEAHDHEAFEVFMYHDFPRQDGHTEAQRDRADHFHDVFALPDEQLCQLIRSHRLDILVELAGQTSHNRASMLVRRMAPVQISALGYPPTMGLRSIDAKVVDRFIRTPDDPRHYAEFPVALPGSFWCFDPKEPVPLEAEPPVLAAGHITFGSVGNIAKVSERVARTWARILASVPGSRLLVRSISFLEPMAQQRFGDLLRAWDLPMERVDFRQPEGGLNLFNSYNEIDVILDTFPFNGGTTSCFATYMGVPVISLAGSSVVGRMGASVLGNVGASDLVVTTLEDYWRRATELANDVEYLRRYKREIRGRLERTGLGNPSLFAREFEQACIELVQARRAGRLGWDSRIEPLPAKEIMRRAYEVVRRGNVEAGRRIVGYALREYPDYGPAHGLLAQMMVWSGRQAEAIAHLDEHLPRMTPSHQVGTLLGLTRMHLLGRDAPSAAATLGRLDALPVDDAFDAAQARLYGIACADAAVPDSPAPSGTGRRVLLLIAGDDRPAVARLRQQLEELLVLPPGWTVRIEGCPEADRLRTYRGCTTRDGWDVLLLLRRNVGVVHPRFLFELGHALESADIVSFAGAQSWSRLDWQYDRYEAKAGGFIGASGENPDMVELQLVGPGDAALVGGLAVLDGRLLAIRREAAALGEWDEDLVGCQALMEEAWVHSAGRQGARLAVHRGLGVFIDNGIALDDSNRPEARMHCATTMGFDPFTEPAEDFVALSVPVPDTAEALRVAANYLERVP